MKWFDEWFYSKARWAWQRGGKEHPEWKRREDLLDQMAVDDAPDMCLSSSRAIETDSHDLYDGLRIDVKRLHGGYVVTFRHTQQYQNSTKYVGEEIQKNSYIVTEDEDFDDRLGKLITMELLR